MGDDSGHAVLLTARAVASRVGVSTETVLRWTRRGELPGFRLPGGALRYREDALEDWLRRRSTEHESEKDRPAPTRLPAEVSRSNRTKTRGGDQDATNTARRGVQAQLW